MVFTVDRIQQLYSTHGHRQYGESVTQLQHALQCARLAEAADQPAAMIAAALLHDLGHLLWAEGDRAANRGIDDRHEFRALPALQPLFPPAVTEPIRLHVAAKRYLCAIDSTYWDSLSTGSQQTLRLQGGVFSPQAAAAFIAQPYAAAAVQLRRWDDRAKGVGLETPDFEHFLPYLRAAQVEGSTEALGCP